MAADLVRRLHAIVDERISLALGARPVELERGTVDSVVSSLRIAMVRIGESSTPVPVTYPALPVTLAAGDEVVIQRRRDGWLLISDVLDRDPAASSGGGDGAPTDAAYLVTAAHDSLTAEVVVGATPGGELGGTWDAPTVDSVHAGSAHHSHGSGAVGDYLTDELTGDNIDMPSNNTVTSTGVSVTLGVGTWDVRGRVTIASGASATDAKHQAFMYDGTTYIDEAETNNPSFSGSQAGGSIPLMAIVVVESGTKTITLYGSSNRSGADIRANILNNSSATDKATRIVAVRIA